jgi:glycosyltransferase involved in cell wall biosynthesis
VDIPATASTAIVVIAYNDVDNIGAAVASALDQGEAVAEVIVVDDCSTDATPGVLAELAADARVRVISRRTNSGGCGTPRNEGLAAATAPYVLFLDSDDILPPGAVDSLADAGRRADGPVDVVVGKVLRRELPDGRTTLWAPRIHERHGTTPLSARPLAGIGERLDLLWDTLSVGKLYRRAFLLDHTITFPGGTYHYEDFVFTARLYAAEPRLLLTDVPAYIWQVRRQAAQLSLSLRRGELRNWQDRITAHSEVVETFRAAGRGDLRVAAQTKFLDYDVPMYLRELFQREAAYRGHWWHATRAYLRGFDPAAVAAAEPASRWMAEVLVALPDLPPSGETRRLVELACDPPRLVPPYPVKGGVPVFADGDTAIPLDGMAAIPVARLPVTVEGTFDIGTAVRLDVRVHDLYGRLAALSPVSVDVELVERTGECPPIRVRTALHADGDCWRARAEFRADCLMPHGPLAHWAVRAEIGYADGSATGAEVRAGRERRPRPSLVLLGGGRPLVVRTHVTERRSLVLRTASGLEGARRAAAAARSMVRRLPGSRTGTGTGGRGAAAPEAMAGLR